MANISDKFGRAGSDTSYAAPTTVKVARQSGDSVLQCFDLSTFSAKDPVFFTTYKKVVNPQKDNEVTILNQTSWKAVVNPDNNTLTNLTLAPGSTDVGNEVGDFVECGPTDFWNNELIDGLEVSLGGDGKIKKGAVTNDSINDNSIDAKALADKTVTAAKINSVFLQELGQSIAAVSMDGVNYYNAGSSRARLKKQIIQRGNITIDFDRNEFIIGKGVKLIELTGTIMAEGLRTYLYLIAQRKHKDEGDEKYKQFTQALGTPHTGYSGITLYAVIPVQEEDRISLLHDCTGTIRGQQSNIIVRSIA